MSDVGITEESGTWHATVPTFGGTAHFVFEDVEQPRRHLLEAEVTVWEEVPGTEPEVFVGHLNILSLNMRETFRRGLDDTFGKGQWTSHLNVACRLMRDAWQNKDWSIDLAPVEFDETATYLIPPYVIDGLPSILFGPGETGKTYLTLALAKAVCEDGEFLGEQVRMGRVLFVDYEATEREVKRRLHRLGMRDYSGIVYWPGRGPITEILPAIQRKVSGLDVALVIVDSAVMAAGGDPKEDVTASGYFRALSKLGVASLTISHMTKDEKDDTHPFGSIFWYNSARLIWNVKAAEDGTDKDVKRLGLFCRKSNEDRRPPAHGVRLIFAEDGKTVVRTDDLADEFRKYLGKRSQLLKLLSNGALTVKEVAEEMGIGTAAAHKLLQRTDGIVSFGEAGKEHRYGLAAEQA